KNSTNLPTTFALRSISVTVSTRSVAVTPARTAPERWTPTTSGVRKYTGWPSMAASASMPPTPQARVHRGRGGDAEEHTSELQSRENLVCRLLLEKKELQSAHVVQVSGGGAVRVDRAGCAA